MTDACPWCGSPTRYKDSTFQLECVECGACGPVGGSHEQAVDLWFDSAQDLALRRLSRDLTVALRERDSYFLALKYVRELLDTKLDAEKLQKMKSAIDSGIGSLASVN